MELPGTARGSYGGIIFGVLDVENYTRIECRLGSVIPRLQFPLAFLEEWIFLE